VNRGNILAILRQLSESGPPATDAELLARFVADRDEAAFAAIVRRHGRLVWSVCRHLAGSEADDAFQATFLVLLRKAGRLCEKTNLPAWLHAVAYRVCSNARRAAKRRAGRERAVAGNGQGHSVVADSAWDRAMAAVHEEVARLPEALRVPFVLCCLEGCGVTEAAEQLGWKLGTLSGRLTRAKDALLARLSAREVLAGVGAVSVLAGTSSPAPAEVVAKASQLVQQGTVVAGSILHLSQGVIGMSISHVKCLAAAVLLACGLGVGGGAGWLANAEAQQPPPGLGRQQTAEERVIELQVLLEQAKSAAEREKALERARKDQLNVVKQYYGYSLDERATLSTAKWDYKFLPVKSLDATEFVSLLNGVESLGWEYNGQTTLKEDGKDKAMWTFRRPVRKSTENKNDSNPPGGRPGNIPPGPSVSPLNTGGFPNGSTPGTPSPFERGSNGQTSPAKPSTVPPGSTDRPGGN
jgi:RNA polymerase sigma factor (sigma-70 family)